MPAVDPPDPSADSDAWAGYYARREERPPRRTVLTALDLFEREGLPLSRWRAVDLGCGSGRDTVALIDRGWSVTAIDAEPAAITRLSSRFPAAVATGRLTAVQAAMEAADWSPVSLTNASFSLPLVAPDLFDAFFRRLADRLLPGGRLACQLFGDRDSFVGRHPLTFHDRDQALARFAGWRLEVFEEEESEGESRSGRPKHWHLFHIVAQRP